MIYGFAKQTLLQKESTLLKISRFYWSLKVREKLLM